MHKIICYSERTCLTLDLPEIVLLNYPINFRLLQYVWASDEEKSDEEKKVYYKIKR